VNNLALEDIPDFQSPKGKDRLSRFFVGSHPGIEHFAAAEVLIVLVVDVAGGIDLARGGNGFRGTLVFFNCFAIPLVQATGAPAGTVQDLGIRIEGNGSEVIFPSKNLLYGLLEGVNLVNDRLAVGLIGRKCYPKV
jgi:hypothetical protein